MPGAADSMGRPTVGGKSTVSPLADPSFEAAVKAAKMRHSPATVRYVYAQDLSAVLSGRVFARGFMSSEKRTATDLRRQLDNSGLPHKNLEVVFLHGLPEGAVKHIATIPARRAAPRVQQRRVP